MRVENSESPFIRTQVRWFAEQMSRVLDRHSQKSGWSSCTRPYLIRRLREEVDELEYELLERRWEEVSRAQVIREACDVANFAMMIADRVREHPRVRP